MMDPIYLSCDALYAKGADTIKERLKERRNEMTEKGQIYKCDICGNVVSVLEAGDGDLVCCGENMRLLTGEEAQKY
jgi:desulfoferrodoxin-like iron-binding protein